MQPYLGDIVGEPLPPMRVTPRPKYKAPRWIENGLNALIGWLAVTAYGLLIAVWLFLVFYFSAVHGGM